MPELWEGDEMGGEARDMSLLSLLLRVTGRLSVRIPIRTGRSIQQEAENCLLEVLESFWIPAEAHKPKSVPSARLCDPVNWYGGVLL